VVDIKFEVDRVDELLTNTRIAIVPTEESANVPDRRPWEFDGLRGTALLCLQVRLPRCYRCAERGHKFYQCPYPFCTLCREVRHAADAERDPLTYAERTSGVMRRDDFDDMEMQRDEMKEPADDTVQMEDSAVGASQNQNRESVTKETSKQDPSDKPTSET